MQKGEIIETLERWNFWRRDIDSGIIRDQTPEIMKALKYDKIITLTGVRRSGKSYILRQLAKNLISKGVPREDILIVNFEEPHFSDADLNILLKIYEAYMEIIKPAGKPYIFLDEIQEVKKWERFVRTLNETKEAHVVITGSSSKLMSEELASILTGRQMTYEIFPLSFLEYLRFMNINIKEEKDIYLNASKIKRAIYDYIENGGFPEIFFIKENDLKRKILLDYYDTIINRDIIHRYRVREIEKLRNLAKYYLTNISTLITYRKAGNSLEIPVETVSRFSEYLKTTKLIYLITRFSFSVKEQSRGPKKIYSIDTGLSNAVGFRFRENYSKLMENAVAIELLRRNSRNPFLEIYYWKDYQQHEVDFVVKEGFEIKELIQVCYNIQDFETKKREIRSLIKASAEFNCKTLLVITWDYEAEEKVKWRGREAEVKFLPLWKWLLI